ncbi:MAG: NAD-binding protein [Mycobacteriaceae bacterium]
MSIAGLGQSQLSGHVIVCGTGGMSLRIVDELQQLGDQVVVLGYGSDEQISLSFAHGNVPYIAVTSGISATLVLAGVHDAIAVICADDSDVNNIETALIARELNSTVRVVTQLGNTVVGRAMAQDNGPGAVLDIADLAAPSVVEACLGVLEHRIVIDSVEFVVAELPVPQQGSLRQLFADLAPVAVVRGEHWSDAGQALASPGRDQFVAVGDRAIMVGTREELSACELIEPSVGEAARAARPARSGVFTKMRATAQALIEDADAGLFRSIGILTILVGISTAILTLGHNRPSMGFVDSLYFSVETVTTVGYGDFNFLHQPVWMRLWAIALMIGGIATTGIIMAFIADLLISRRLSKSLGRRRAKGFSGHVVVIGLGSFGVRVVSQLLSEHRQVVVIERDENNRFLSTVEELDIPVVFGDATHPSTLLAAGVSRASATAVLTSDDLINIETSIALRELLGSKDPAPIVVRVFDKTLGRSISRRFGFTGLRSTQELAVPWFVGAALGLEVLSTFSAGQQSFMVGKMQITSAGELVDLQMSELSAGIQVIAIARAQGGKLEYPPRRDTRFCVGDTAYLCGPHEELLTVLRS